MIVDTMPSDEQLFVALQMMIKKRVPKFQVKYKDESKWQKFIGKLAFFNRKYMTKYTTTSYPKVFFPSRKFVEDNKFKAFKVLAHEYLHLLDRKKRAVIFELFYAAPQWLMIFSLLAFLAFWFSNWWLMALTSLIALGPWPAFGRASLEMRGYGMNIAINIWRHGSIKDDTRQDLVEKFTNWDYYKMWPFEKAVSEWISEYEQLVYNVDAIKTEETILDQSEAFQDVYELLTGIEHG